MCVCCVGGGGGVWGVGVWVWGRGAYKSYRLYHKEDNAHNSYSGYEQQLDNFSVDTRNPGENHLQHCWSQCCSHENEMTFIRLSSTLPNMDIDQPASVSRLTLPLATKSESPCLPAETPFGLLGVRCVISNDMVQGPIAQTVYELLIEISGKMPLSNLESINPIMSRFCKCHHSWAVITPTKLWPDRINSYCHNKMYS